MQTKIAIDKLQATCIFWDVYRGSTSSTAAPSLGVVLQTWQLRNIKGDADVHFFRQGGPDGSLSLFSSRSVQFSTYTFRTDAEVTRVQNVLKTKVSGHLGSSATM